jgi:hypothetical protein
MLAVNYDLSNNSFQRTLLGLLSRNQGKKRSICSMNKHACERGPEIK